MAQHHGGELSVMGCIVTTGWCFSELRKEPGNLDESGFIAQKSEFVVGNV